MHDQARGPATITVEHLGGIDHCELTLSPGVTILTGRNATGRTSLLSALASALGGSSGRLKTDATRGSVALALGDERIQRTFTRTDDGVTVDGTGLADTDLVDTFASLLADNPARRAVERGADLRPIVMSPVDTGSIETEIEACETALDEVTARLDEIDRQTERLPALQERATELRTELEAIESDLASARAAVESDDRDADLADDATDLLDALESHRDQRSRLVEKRRTQRRSIEALEAERDEIEREIDERDPPEADLASVESSIEELQGRERSLSRTIEELTTIVEFNDDLLAGSVPAALAADESDAGDGEALQCWTCGNAVEESALSERLSELRAVVERKRAERKRVEADLDDRRDRRRRLTERRREYEELCERRETVAAELDRRRDRVATIENELDAVDAEIATLESELEATAVEDTEALDQYQRVSDLEYRRGRVEGELGDVAAEIDRLDELAAEREELVERRQELTTERERLRTRIVDRERAAVETFNERVAEVLALLDYDNVERVWIERTVTDGEPARASSFDLHVERAGPEGTYEDDVGTLSESERAVIGLLIALPGYLVHDVADSVPFVLLDSLEAIDADRIAALVDYFADHAPYLVVALLPEDAAALSDDYDRIPADEIG